jgi:hypothetical protein
MIPCLAGYIPHVGDEFIKLLPYGRIAGVGIKGVSTSGEHAHQDNADEHLIQRETGFFPTDLFHCEYWKVDGLKKARGNGVTAVMVPTGLVPPLR